MGRRVLTQARYFTPLVAGHAKAHHLKSCKRQATWPAWGALMISSTVCAVGALRLISMARMPNRMIWMVAPAAYQNGPDTPYLYATLELCSSVAAHVLHTAT